MSDRPNDIQMRCFEQLCRKRGLPLTVQRRAVLEVMLGRDDHPTADLVYAEIRARLPGVSRASVYRILEMLVSTGMVTKVCHPGLAARFDPKTSRHHHLVCSSCERIIDVEQPRLNRVPLPDVRGQGFQIDDYHIYFRGTCAECLRKQKASVCPARLPGGPKPGLKTMPVKGRKKVKRRPR
jgi:Fur family peroxide stress response transcriptional regulator